MAARQGVRGLERQPEEILLAIVINHPALAIKHLEQLSEEDFRAAGLDKLRKAIIDEACKRPDLDSETLRSHLTDKGFAEAVQSLLLRTKDKKFTRAAAPVEVAESELLHQFGLMRERRDKRERAFAELALASDQSEKSYERLRNARQATLDGESRRQDVDLIDTLSRRARHA